MERRDWNNSGSGQEHQRSNRLRQREFSSDFSSPGRLDTRRDSWIAQKEQSARDLEAGMKVLFIAQGFPYPPNTGSRNLGFHWLDAASRAHDVHLLWLGDPAEGKDRIPELPGVKIDAIRAVPAMELSARIRRLATAIVLGIPPTSLIGMTEQARSEILGHVRTGHYDLVVLTENVVAGYAPLICDHTPVVLLKHSVQAVDARDARRRSGMWHPRWILEEWLGGRFGGGTGPAPPGGGTATAAEGADSH